MSRKFFAVDRVTGERWTPDPRQTKQYLVMYDSGYLAVVTEYRYEGSSIQPLDPKKWRKVLQGEENIPAPKTKPFKKETCTRCSGSGKTMEIVDHDFDYNTVWGEVNCMSCNGQGFKINYI